MAHELHQRGRYWLLPLLMLRFAGLSRCGVAGERPNGKGGVVAWPVTVGSVHPDHEALPWTEVATFAELERGCRQSGGGKFRITANLKFPRHITISGDATTTQVTISGRIPPPATADGKHTFVLHGQNRTNFFSVRNNGEPPGGGPGVRPRPLRTGRCGEPAARQFGRLRARALRPVPRGR